MCALGTLEYRSRFAELAAGAYLYWTPVFKTDGSTGVTGQSQIVDTRAGTASVADAALGVGETLVLDLDDIGAVVTVDAVDAAPPACTEASRSPESFLAIESISVRCASGSSPGRGFVRPRAAGESAADALLASVKRRAPPSRDEKRSESPSSNTRRA